MTINDVVNVELLSHPYNYLVVGLTLMFISFVLCLLFSPLGSVSGLTQVI